MFAGRSRWVYFSDEKFGWDYDATQIPPEWWDCIVTIYCCRQHLLTCFHSDQNYEILWRLFTCLLCIIVVVIITGINLLQQPNSQFHGRDIFCEIQCCPWRAHCSIKSHETLQFSVNFYPNLLLFIYFILFMEMFYLAVVKNNILAYLLPNWRNQLLIHDVKLSVIIQSSPCDSVS